MVRRLLRLAVTGFCLLSLLACLGAGWLWWRGQSGHRDRVSFMRAGDRFTLSAGPGLLMLTGPPPSPPTAGSPAGMQAGRLRNGDLAWRAWIRHRRRDGVREIYLVPEDWSDRYSPPFELAAGGQEVGLLLRALEDPERFVAAHALLVQYLTTSRPPWEPACSYLPLPGRADGSFGATYDGLRLELELMVLAPTPLEGFTLESRDRAYVDEVSYHSAWADPAQLPALRDSWHERLDVPLWSVPHWQVMSVTILPPLLWLGARTGRALALRHRRKLGLCLNCGYDLRGSAGSGRCSECGEAVPADAKGAAA